ncbi:hypothetical protein [Thermogladius calderae]|uniref:hypothetical protein n=1 Tax=Thermogladius calderae TaxID=1200300 RepID=UPI00064F9490|nr:hypothetical protein [Thermogladius calderae]
MRYKPLYDFLALVLSLIVGIVSSYTMPLTQSVEAGLLVLSLWLALTGLLLEKEPSVYVSRRTVRGSLGVILFSLSIAGLLPMDMRAKALVVVAGLGFSGLYAYVLERG